MLSYIKVVVFDLGRVLIDFDHNLSASAFAKITKKPAHQIYNLFFDSPLVASFEEGKISPYDFFVQVKQLLKTEDLSYEQFCLLWNDIFYLSEENKQVYQLAKKIKQHYKIALLSNVNILHWQYLIQKFAIFDVFDYIFTSFSYGYIKPHPKIYEIMLNHLAVEPGEVFYVDDRPELIAQARKQGINGFVYYGIEQLYKDLACCGIIL
ncbi:MAG: HAD family phosphatase [Candidatus Omnitrophica bacterium]|nr:HAD family phosphatase [Candidatus Omnitrophota bacterium]